MPKINLMIFTFVVQYYYCSYLEDGKHVKVQY